MQNLKILKFEEDIQIEIKTDFTIRFYSQSLKINSSYPIVLPERMELDIPNEKKDIQDFLFKKISFLKGEEAYELMELLNQNMLSFLNLLMKDNKIDLMFYTKRNIKFEKNEKGQQIKTVHCSPILLANIIGKDQCVYFDGKMLPYKDILKLKKIDSIKSKEVAEDNSIKNIKEFIQKKINNNIKNNILFINEAEKIHNLLSDLDIELKKYTNFNLMKVLEIYNEIFIIKSNYYGVLNVDISAEEMLDVANDMKQIKLIPINTNINVYNV